MPKKQAMMGPMLVLRDAARIFWHIELKRWIYFHNLNLGLKEVSPQIQPPIHMPCVVCDKNHRPGLDCKPTRDAMHEGYGNEETLFSRRPKYNERLTEGFEMLHEMEDA